MKITKVDVIQEKVPERASWRPILCRIYTDEGIYGDGEAALAYGIAAPAAFGMVRDLAALIIGMDPLDNEVIWDKLYKATFWGQNGGPVVFAGISALDIALWDMRVLSRDEQDRLIKAARQAPEPAAFGIIFDLFTGLRLGELCGLRWQNVDMEQGIFRVCETRNRLPNHDDSIAASTSVKTVSSTKTDHSRRTVYLLDELLEDLAYYKEIQDSITAEYSGYNREGYVFCQENGQPYEPRTYQDLFKRCVRQAGIKYANFHALRHTFATRSLEAGMDVVTLSRLLGHANPSITMDKYGHALDDHKRASIGKLGGIYAGAKKTPAAKKRDER